MAYVTSNRAPANSLSARFADFRTNVIEGYSNWRVYRNTLTELQSLSGRELADLGINASMIRSIAMEAAYGKKA